MPRLTKRDEIIRRRWADFLKPLVGVGMGRVSVTALDGRVAELTDRSGDARGEVYAYLQRRQTVRAERAFWIGEALRDCGICWSTGFGGVWAASYFGEYVRRLTNLAQIPGRPPDREPFVESPLFRDLAVIVGTHAPLYASPSLALDLHADAEWLDKDRRAFAALCVPHLLDAPEGFAKRRKDRHALPCDDWLVHAATLGDDQKVPIEIRERHVWTLVVEWAIEAASPVLREGRVANIAGLLAARPRLLIETAREAALARGRDPKTSASRTGRRKA